MLNITIPKPCHEDWDKMTDSHNGRYCGSCMKTVINFSSMSDDEVKNFLISKKDEQLCGRFSERQLKTIQIELPSNIFNVPMPLWKKFLLACLIAFATTLFSCEVKHDNPSNSSEPAVASSLGKTFKASGESYKDILYDKTAGYVGGMMIQWDSTIIETVDTTIATAIPDTTGMLMGVPVFISTDNTFSDTIPLIKPDTLMKKGEIKMIPDPLPKKKDPPNADSLNCVDFS